MLNELCESFHEKSVDKGFYDEKHEIGTMLMLVTSELTEALEADRKGRFANLDKFIAEVSASDGEGDDNKFIKAFEKYIKDTLEDEIADAVIRLFDLCGYLGIDLDSHVAYKVLYNEKRPYKHGKTY